MRNWFFIIVEQVYLESNRIYGYKKIFQTVNKWTTDISLWHVRLICQIKGFLSIRIAKTNKLPKERKDLTRSKPNLVKNINITKINQVWAIDISYLKTKKGFIYLSAIIDLYSWRIMDYKISSKNDTNLVLQNFHDALAKAKGYPKIIHSDNGYQYTSKRFEEYALKNNIKLSKSAPGKSLENRTIEFFFGLLKREKLYVVKPTTQTKYNLEINKYINWYNEFRIQSNLAWNCPMDIYARNMSH